MKYSWYNFRIAAVGYLLPDRQQVTSQTGD
jgi:hypothetical protein